MNEPVISIIVPVYNEEKYIERCVLSICNQTYSNLEILLIDDGSTDKSGEICDALSKIDHRIQVIHKENGGISSARNKGLDIASGSFIGFVDSDDWIERDMFDSLLRCINNSGIQMARCGIDRKKIYEFNDNNDIQNIDSYKVLNLAEAAISIWENGFMCNKLFSAELFQSEPCIRFNNKIKYVEDQPVVFDCLIKSQKMAEIKDVKYHYYVNPNSLTGTKFNLNNISSIIGFKHMCYMCDKNIPELSDLFRSKYYSICIGFLQQRITRQSTEHKKLLSSELRKNLKEILKLHNMRVKFKIAAILFSIV